MRKKAAYILFIILVLTSCMCYSQSKNSPLPKPGGDPHPELPIDGGVSVLFVIGIACGVYKLKKKNL